MKRYEVKISYERKEEDTDFIVVDAADEKEALEKAEEKFLENNWGVEITENKIENVMDVPKCLPKIVSTPEEWVYKAVSTDFTRRGIHHSFAVDGVLVGTNGHFLNMIKTDLPDGYYNEKGEAITHDGTPPDYNKVIPDDKDLMDGLEITEHEVSGDLYKFKDYKTGFNKEYVNTILNGELGILYLNKDPMAPSKILLSGGRQSLIMPVRY